MLVMKQRTQIVSIILVKPYKHGYNSLQFTRSTCRIRNGAFLLSFCFISGKADSLKQPHQGLAVPLDRLLKLSYLSFLSKMG